MTILEKAKQAKENGSPLTIEQIVFIYEKSEANKAKKAKSKAKKWASRASGFEVEKIAQENRKNITTVDFQNWDEKIRKEQMNLIR